MPDKNDPSWDDDPAPLSAASLPEVENVKPNAHYDEGDALFSELKEFGETQGSLEQMSVEALSHLNVAERSAEVPLSSPPPLEVVTEDYRMTPSAEVSGYRILRYFPPLSLMGELEEGEDPLRIHFDKLWALAQAKGANAVVGLSWSISQNFTKVLIVGTPVRCEKANADI